MLNVKRGVLVPLCVLGLSAPLSAQVFNCQVTETGEASNWIAPDMIFGLDADGSVQVNDGWIQQENGGPIMAKVSKNTEETIAFSWALDMTNTAVQSTRMTYRATFDRASGKIRVHARPTGYDNDFEGRGSCTQG